MVVVVPPSHAIRGSTEAGMSEICRDGGLHKARNAPLKKEKNMSSIFAAGAWSTAGVDYKKILDNAEKESGCYYLGRREQRHPVL